MDRKVPWGRPPEDIIARRRERTNHKLHRQRLRDSRSQIDSSKPTTTDMNHLRVRAKKRQIADDRLQSIAMENRKLMEKMSAIMRKAGPATGGIGGVKDSMGSSKNRPLMKGEAVYNKGGLHDVMRKKEQRRIALENKTILQKLRAGKETKSFYDHNTMARNEIERLKYIRNISKKYQRDLRAQKYNKRKKMLAERSPERDNSFEADQEGYGFSQIMDGAMNLSLHTAKQIRMDVANQRGMPLPDIISKRPGDVAAPRKIVKMPPLQQQPQPGFVLKHEGQKAGDNVSFDFAGDANDDGGFADYDYNSAEGGEFHGRGYSASTNQRPTTTQESGRGSPLGEGLDGFVEES